MTHMTRSTPAPRWRRRAAVLLSAALLGSLAGCAASGSATTPSDDASADPSAAAAEAPELRLGYFANVTHATPLVGVGTGRYADELGDTKLTTQIFNAGPAAVEALFAGSLDAAYLGPNPAINAFTKSDGEAVRIIAGATSGGAQLVVRDGIDDAADLRGKTLATPQVGGTQDVALRAWLLDNGLKTSVTGGQNDVTIAPQENPQTLELFKSGQLDGAWLPEPWASRLVLEGGGKVLVDEKDLWPGGKFVTTHLIVRTEFLDKYPGTVQKLLEAQVATNEWIAANGDEARTAANAAIEELTGKKLADDVLERAWSNITVTNDPVATSLATSAKHGEAVGVTKSVDIDGIYDLAPLNKILEAHGLPTVSAGGLGTE
jgi:NitT/TauT family transport system substrate-binding protein